MVKLSFGIVALGANLPVSGHDLWTTLRSTLDILHAGSSFSITSVSRFWQTPAVPAGSGPDFANAVACGLTSLDAAGLLTRLHETEAAWGRDRGTGRWSSRVLDLDLIAFDGAILPDADHLRRWIKLPPDLQRVDVPDQLVLPHPRLQDRAFVLAPLAEIAPAWRHPLTGRSVVQMLADLGPDALVGMTPMALREMPAFA